ncbi:hypothetical protein KIPB_014882, partial [Kipferlia bialata]
FCREVYFITLHVGLATCPWGRYVAWSVLSAFDSQPMTHMQPNIVFKKTDSLHAEGAPNHDLYLQALAVTARRMIPTYLLLDSAPNADCDNERIGISGCRSRVDQNENGRAGAYGRGNAAFVTLNLVRLALQSTGEGDFFQRLSDLLPKAKAVLDSRNEALLKGHHCAGAFPLWHGVETIQDLIASATHSVGFIGLSETVEVLTGDKLHESDKARDLGMAIVRHMRAYVDGQRKECGMNYSLLATTAEYLSGRFIDRDRADYPHPVTDKGFYTNSFHVEVDSKVSIPDKLRLEGPFHLLCNGGSISYVE